MTSLQYCVLSVLDELEAGGTGKFDYEKPRKTEAGKVRQFKFFAKMMHKDTKFKLEYGHISFIALHCVVLHRCCIFLQIEGWWQSF